MIRGSLISNSYFQLIYKGNAETVRGIRHGGTASRHVDAQSLQHVCSVSEMVIPLMLRVPKSHIQSSSRTVRDSPKICKNQFLREITSTLVVCTHYVPRLFPETEWLATWLAAWHGNVKESGPHY